jgi:hypothetical protein
MKLPVEEEICWLDACDIEPRGVGWDNDPNCDIPDTRDIKEVLAPTCRSDNARPELLELNTRHQ